MHLNRLYLRNFRNFEEASFCFDKKVNLICGSNGIGKTNLLEAIYLVSTGRSFRSSHLADLIRCETNFFYLEAVFYKDAHEQALSLYFDKKTKKLTHDNQTYSHFSPLLGLLPTVLYTPQDASLIMGGPTLRRKFLDMHIAQFDPQYVYSLIRFFKALKQRNHLLKIQQINSITAWEQIMAETASYITDKRNEAINKLSPLIEQAIKKLSNHSLSLQLQYLPSLKETSPEAIKKQYADHRTKEIHQGLTSSGIHKDDFLILTDEREAKIYASEGQKRSAIAALRLAEKKRLSELVSAPPLFSIDDFGAHLDPYKIELFEKEIDSSEGQVFISSPHLLKQVSCHHLSINTHRKS
ncbi:MAG: DNA replication/repair protein RecF [Rhabdochlamydiaceae bacterium]